FGRYAVSYLPLLCRVQKRQELAEATERVDADIWHGNGCSSHVAPTTRALCVSQPQASSAGIRAGREKDASRNTVPSTPTRRLWLSLANMVGTPPFLLTEAVTMGIERYSHNFGRCGNVKFKSGRPLPILMMDSLTCW